MRYLIGAFIFLLASSAGYSQTDDRPEILNKIISLRSELKVNEEKFLLPAPSDYESYPEFLNQTRAGVIRLLPREEYDKPEKMTIRGGGAYYSFTRLTHEYGYGSDIELSRDEFSVGFAGADYGFMGMLEGGDINSVTIEHPAVQYLLSLKVPVKLEEARIEKGRRGEGITAGGIQYKGRLKALAGKTYVLRSINYDDSDILVCFQTLRKDVDGSWILVWKMLKEFDKPKLERVTEGQ
jgi:hypothetical protein